MNDSHTPIEALVEPAFGDPPDVGAVHRFLEPIRQNLVAADALSHRALRNMVLALVTFEVLVRAGVSEVNVSVLRVSDLTIVQRALPLVIAFYCYQMLAALAARRLMMDAHDKAMGLVHLGEYESDVRRFFHPPSLLGNESLLSTFAVGAAGKLWHLLSYFGMFALVLLPPILIAYAIASNFRRFGSGDWLLLAISGLSVLLVVKALLAIGIAQRAVSVPELPKA